MPSRDLIQRTAVFALAVTRFLRTLPLTDEAREIAGQLRRSANGVRSNYRAARKGRSRAEFESKLGTACEEADECVGWFEHLRDTRIGPNPVLLDESNQLLKVLSQALITSKKNSARLKKLPKS
jgi:four helix bundle protein